MPITSQLEEKQKITTENTIQFLIKKFPELDGRIRAMHPILGVTKEEGWFYDAIYTAPNGKEVLFEFKHLKKGGLRQFKNSHTDEVADHITYTRSAIQYETSGKEKRHKIYFYFTQSETAEDGSYTIDENAPIWCANALGVRKYMQRIDLTKPTFVFKNGCEKFAHNISIFRNKNALSELFTDAYLLKNYR